MPPESLAPVSIAACPGIRPFSSPPVGLGRGLTIRKQQLYALVGDSYYRVNGAGTATFLDYIHGSFRAYFANNGAQSVIVSDGSAYSEINGVIARILDPDLLIRHLGPCAFVDNYVLFIDIGSQEFIGTALGDVTAIGPLDFASAEGAPDNLVGLVVDHRQPILFGEDSTELWYDDGGSGFPFARSSGGFVETGCLAPRSTIKADNSVFWLANDLTFRRLSGDTAVRVSHHGVEEALKGFANPSDCEALTFTHNGHIQIAFNFITDNATWVWDITTSEWFERDSFPAKVWRVVDAVSWKGSTYVQDRKTGAIGVLDDNYATEWGDLIRYEWGHGPVYQDNKRIFHGCMETVMEVGIGAITGDGSTPTVLLEWSDTGGSPPWQNGTPKSLGVWGHHHVRVTDERLGESRNRVYRHVITDPVRVRVYDTQLDKLVGTG